MVVIQQLTFAEFETAIPNLSSLLQDCVHNGASIGFLSPLPNEEASAFWNSLSPALEQGTRVMFVAREHVDGSVVGTVQIVFESKPNGRHRAEVSKLMVASTHRRQGIAQKLLDALEILARERSLLMLFLDTSEGKSGASGLYEKAGFTYAGGIPFWARDPDGTMAKNAIYYKLLEPCAKQVELIEN